MKYMIKRFGICNDCSKLHSVGWKNDMFVYKCKDCGRIFECENSQSIISVPEECKLDDAEKLLDRLGKYFWRSTDRYPLDYGGYIIGCLRTMYETGVVSKTEYLKLLRKFKVRLEEWDGIDTYERGNKK